MKDNVKEDKLRSWVVVLANMVYGFNGSDKNNPKINEDDLWLAANTLNDIGEFFIQDYIEWFNIVTDIKGSDRNWWSLEEYKKYKIKEPSSA